MVALGTILRRTDLALDVLHSDQREVEVVNVHSSELPDISRWLVGGEILLTSGSIQDLAADSARDYLASIRSAGAVAVGIGLGEDLPWQTVPTSLVTHAAAVGITLFAVPAEVPFVAVTEAFTRLREAEFAQSLSQTLATQRRLTTVLSRSGVAEFVRVLGEVLGTPVALASATGRILHRSDPRAATTSAMRVRLTSLAWANTQVPTILAAHGRASGGVDAMPIGTPDLAAWLLVGRSGRGPEATDAHERSLLISSAASLLALGAPGPNGTESGPTAAGAVAEHSLAEVLSVSPLAGYPRTAGGPAAGPSPVPTAAFPRPRGTTAGRARWAGLLGDPVPERVDMRIGRLPTRSADRWVELLRDCGALVHLHGAEFLVVAPEPVAELVDVLCGATQVAEHASLDPAEVPAAWRRHRRAASGSDLAAFLAGSDPRAAADFVATVLGPFTGLEAGVARTVVELARAGGNREAASEYLGVHRHTVRQRISRAEAVLEVDLRDPGTQRTIAVAVELAEVLGLDYPHANG